MSFCTFKYIFFKFAEWLWDFFSW